MSSILKALKKLEDEKAVRQPNTLRINSEILRDSSQAKSRFTVLVIAVLLFVGGGGTAYLFMKAKVESPVTKGDVVAIVPPPVAPPVFVSPPVTVAAPKQAKQESAAEVPNPKTPVVKNTATPQKNTVVAAPLALAKKQAVAKPTAVNAHEPKVAAKVPAVPATHPVPVAHAPSLKVNGIAFQDETADRIAVVNGISVSIGSVVEGAKVEDIQRDRIRFSYNGERFEIGLGKSN